MKGSERQAPFFAQKDAKDFELFDAIDGRKIDPEPYFDVETFHKNNGVDPTPSEIGCALSHAKLITDFAKDEGSDDDYIVIAEDDISFTKYYSEVLQWVLSQKQTYDLMMLTDIFGFQYHKGILNFSAYGAHLSLLSKVKLTSDNVLFRMGRYVGNPWSTALYMMSRGGAKKFAKLVEESNGRCWWVADDYDIWGPAAGVILNIVKPSVVELIDYDERINLNLYERFMRDKPHLLSKNPINILKFIKLKMIMVPRATKTDIAERRVLRKK